MSEQRPYWREIRCDHLDTDEDHEFWSLSIDAWRTDDDNEEGEIIAKVFGAVIKGETVVFVDYRNHIARCDPLAREKIAEAKQRMSELLQGREAA